jgi:hypothetical protein
LHTTYPVEASKYLKLSDINAANSATLSSGTKSCHFDGCAITHTFSNLVLQAGTTALLSVEQSGDLNSDTEYIDLFAGSNAGTRSTTDNCASGYSWCCNGKCVDTDYIRDGDNDCGDGSDETSPAFQCKRGDRLASCKTTTNQWAKALTCQNMDVTKYITSSGSLKVTGDATRYVDADDDDANGPENTEFSARFTLVYTPKKEGTGTNSENRVLNAELVTRMWDGDDGFKPYSISSYLVRNVATAPSESVRNGINHMSATAKS